MLVIFPVERKLNWQQPPLATLGIILLNVLIFFFFQIHENNQLGEAIHFYRNSPLLSIEYPYYAQLKEESYLKPTINNQQPSDTILVEMLSDKDWNLQLKKGLLSPNEENYPVWLKNRLLFDQQIAQIPTFSSGYKAGNHFFKNSFSYMYLHGGIGHLFGNMVFLLIFGFSLEVIFGKLQFLLLYHICGVCSALFYGLFNLDSFAPLVGASGAIGGLMGAYAAVYGLKKIKFFYWIFGYFNYIQLPALVVLPLWIGKEVWENIASEGSQVAYMAHVGGLMSGALLSWILTRYFQQYDQSYIETDEEKNDPFVEEQEYAINQIRKLNFARAKTTLLELLKQQPDNLRIIELLYNLTKLRPESLEYKKLVNHLFTVTENQRDLDDWVHEKYCEYRQLNPKGSLATSRLIDLCQRFIRCRCFGEAEKILTLLESSRPDTEILPELMMQLSNAFVKENQRLNAKTWLLKLEKEYKHSPWSSYASRLLDRIEANQDI
ncbi:MAG: hypothetical protein COW84_03250 [Gammaproteobacteria bacterium CG22_combo_CG10-13_8_21_14_all_40_8]|nr:MAG: hypothetical protein COW84_03250 [Gammaproteobacteria bacterium CG22_combo_CG10-13_8_21_14_all_40_8]